MGMPTPKEIELELLGAYVRIARYGRDRRPGGMDHKIHHSTGLPEDPTVLMPAHKAVTGERLALEAVIHPYEMSIALLGLVGLARERWPHEQAEWQPRVEERIRKVATHLAERGVLDATPRDEDGNEIPRRRDRMGTFFAITPRGLAYAKRRVAGTRYGERGRVSILDAVPEEVRKSAPNWAQKELEYGGS